MPSSSQQTSEPCRQTRSSTRAAALSTTPRRTLPQRLPLTPLSTARPRRKRLTQVRASPGLLITHNAPEKLQASAQEVNSEGLDTKVLKRVIAQVGSL